MGKRKRKGPPQPEPSGRETMRRIWAEDARADRLAAEAKKRDRGGASAEDGIEERESRDGVSFGLVSKQQQRIRERQRRDMLREDRRQQEKREREERRLRELDEEVDREVDADLRRFEALSGSSFGDDAAAASSRGPLTCMRPNVDDTECAHYPNCRFKRI